MSMRKITSVVNEMASLGIKLSVDNVRKLELSGIIKTTHNPQSKHREFTDEQFKKTIRNLILYYFNTPIKDIVENKPEVIADRIKKIKKALKLLT